MTRGHVTRAGPAASAVTFAAEGSVRVSGYDPAGAPDPRTWVTGGPRGSASAVWEGDGWQATCPPAAGLSVSLGTLGETKDPGSTLPPLQDSPPPPLVLQGDPVAPLVAKGARGRGPGLGEDEDVGRNGPCC